MKRFAFLLILGFVFLIFPQEIWAQGCSMCKAVASNHEGAEESSKLLNRGIVYLMAIPYLMAGLVAFVWFKNSRKKRSHEEEVKRRVDEAKDK